MKTFYKQRIPACSCTRKEARGKDTLMTSGNCDRKVLERKATYQRHKQTSHRKKEEELIQSILANTFQIIIKKQTYKLRISTMGHGFKGNSK